MPSGQPVSWVAAVIVAVGLIGLSVGTALRIRRRRSRVEAYAPPEPSTSSTEVSPRA